MLRHVVFIKFKSGVTEAEIRELEKSLGGLPGTVPEIKSFEFGRDVVRSERSYDFALVSSFQDLDAMKRYQVHPAHQKVVQLLQQLSESILAVDFEPR
ncbi:MAG: Dabb family protein [Syntrophobacteraceae bacterium]|nr:Dabb family protein [Syntrophobacteraceae bacterium]